MPIHCFLVSMEIIWKRKVIDSRLKEKLRRLLTYNLQKAGVYNYPADRLRLISKMIQERVHQI